jgi:hypothetical protein
MPNKTLYIPEKETTLWDAAQRVADRRGVSLYRVVSEALTEDLPRQDATADTKPADPWAHIASDAA